MYSCSEVWVESTGEIRKLEHFVRLTPPSMIVRMAGACVHRLWDDGTLRPEGGTGPSPSRDTTETLGRAYDVDVFLATEGLPPTGPDEPASLNCDVSGPTRVGYRWQGLRQGFDTSLVLCYDPVTRLLHGWEDTRTNPTDGALHWWVRTECVYYNIDLPPELIPSTPDESEAEQHAAGTD